MSPGNVVIWLLVTPAFGAAADPCGIGNADGNTDTKGVEAVATSTSCTCGSNAATVCTAGQFCRVAADDVGVCLTVNACASGNADGNETTTGQDIVASNPCTCGKVAATQCAAGEYCLVDESETGFCVSSGPAPICHSSTGSQTGPANCLCGAVGCLAATFRCTDGACLPGDDSANDVKPYPDCPAINKSEAHDAYCSCGTNAVCKKDNVYCHAIDPATAECVELADLLSQCTNTNGSVVVSGGDCACGKDKIAQAGEFCRAIDGVGEVKTASDPAFETCPDTGVEAVAVDKDKCICGAAANCRTGDYCVGTGDGSCNPQSLEICPATNGSLAHANSDCHCGSDKAICNTSQYCNVAAGGTTGDCLTGVADSCPDQHGATEVLTSDCTCGTADRCAQGEYCHSDGTCRDSAEISICGTVAYAAVTQEDGECLCGSTKCPVGGYCVAGGTADTFDCVEANFGDAIKLLWDAAVSGAVTKDSCASHCDTCRVCDDDGDDDADDDSNNVACIGQFTATMAAAMNSL